MISEMKIPKDILVLKFSNLALYIHRIDPDLNNNELKKLTSFILKGKNEISVFDLQEIIERLIKI